jgi:hypothetical protein
MRTMFPTMRRWNQMGYQPSARTMSLGQINMSEDGFSSNHASEPWMGSDGFSIGSTITIMDVNIDDDTGGGKVSTSAPTTSDRDGMAIDSDISAQSHNKLMSLKNWFHPRSIDENKSLKVL